VLYFFNQSLGKIDHGRWLDPGIVNGLNKIFTCSRNQLLLNNKLVLLKVRLKILFLIFLFFPKFFLSHQNTKAGSCISQLSSNTNSFSCMGALTVQYIIRMNASITTYAHSQNLMRSC